MSDSEIKTAESRFNKKQWRPNDVRALLSNPPDLKREPCFMCGEHESITELHHVVPVSVLAEFLNGGWIGADEISSPIVWLCPNCHRYVHEAMDGNWDLIKSILPCSCSSFRSGLLDVITMHYNHTIKLIQMQLERVGKAIRESDEEIERLESKMKEHDLG